MVAPDKHKDKAQIHCLSKALAETEILFMCGMISRRTPAAASPGSAL